ncbi:unannotated protein [freshwater metagenome]|uniref:Unannotated protein n=1 Tax=freshwater metagenome TaxID=449393 RepID=A0A6J7QWB2_9ZZZZ
MALIWKLVWIDILTIRGRRRLDAADAANPASGGNVACPDRRAVRCRGGVALQPGERGRRARPVDEPGARNGGVDRTSPATGSAHGDGGQLSRARPFPRTGAVLRQQPL